MSEKKLFILAAGGTGGHLFPAQALAEVLVDRGHDVHLMTDERVRDYGKSFPASETHVVHSASPSFSKPLQLPGRALKLWSGYRKARKILASVKPHAVIGFGGYPSFPPLMAGRSLRIPTAVHEQNSVFGRANTFLAKRVDKIALSFRNTRGLDAALKAKSIFTGNPVRAMVLQAASRPYPDIKQNAAFPLVVFGGSQGASFFSSFIPRVFAELSPEKRKRLRLVQQCRAEDLPAMQKACADYSISAELSPFFKNLPAVMADCALVVCRSGASSIAELGVLGRPAIMVPLPHAIDNDQLRNAQDFAAAGGGWLQQQNDLEAKAFAAFLAQLMDDPATLMKAAAAAKNHGVPDAAQRLADLALSLAETKRS